MNIVKTMKTLMNKFLSNNIIFFGTAILLGTGIGIIVGLAQANPNEPPREPEPLEITEALVAEERKEDEAENREEKKEEKKEEAVTEQKPQTTASTSNTAPTDSKQNSPTINNTPSTPSNATSSRATSNITGLPDTISRYEWVRQGGWKKLVEKAYFKAVGQGALPVVTGVDDTVLYYHIIGVATDPCYASITAELEVKGEMKMEVTMAELIAAPSAICDNMRPQTISVPSLSILTDYLKQLEAEHGLYQKIRGSTIR